ncbi:MAG: purine-nucleoside phosphorylase [Thermodesulfobacteriota bacterium]
MASAEMSHRQRAEEAARFLRGRLGKPDLVLSLGTGLGEAVKVLDDRRVLAYGEIPHFPETGAPGHRGRAVAGRIGGLRVLALEGRLHYYEGFSCRESTLPLRSAALAGAGLAMFINAAGGLNPGYRPGDLMLFWDHLNLIPDNPLRGANVDDWGPRFPDMSCVYDAELLRRAVAVADSLGIGVVTGTYAAVPGPSLETPAETRMLRLLGADAVGMSTVPEVIVARHAGLRVLALSVLANVNDPEAMQPILVEDVLAGVDRAMVRLQRLLRGLLPELA